MNRLTTIACAGLLLAAATLPAGEAAAHGVHHVVHDRYAYAPHYVYRHRAPLPYWLRRHHDFVIWYDLYGFRYAPSLSWHRVYSGYRDDRYWHRHLKHRHAKRDKHRHGRHHGRRHRHRH